MYDILKTLHIITAFVSITLFMYRGAIVYAARRPVSGNLLKIAPHVNDSMLLVLGISLAVMANISPLEQAWLAAKLLLLLVYIVLGMIALKWWRGTVRGGLSWLFAMIAVGYMFCLATQKQLVCALA